MKTLIVVYVVTSALCVTQVLPDNPAIGQEEQESRITARRVPEPLEPSSDDFGNETLPDGPGRGKARARIRLNRKQTAKWRMELLIRKATEDGPGDDDYNYEDYCPERVDAFCSVNNTWYLFVDDDVYVIQNGTIDSLEYIEDIFPGGPTAVNAALYDEDKQRLLLIKNRTVYAFKQETSGEFVLDKKFPKAITASITFEPVGAMRWYDKRQVLLSKDGRFALYDEYWNKSLMTGRIEDHFEGLPKDVRGISTWIAGEACVFKSTHALIYKHKNGQYILSQETPVAKFLKCK